MSTECSSKQLEFEGIGTRRVVGAFDAGEASSDAGWLLLRELEAHRGILEGFAACFRDLRDPARRKHEVDALVRQRVLALCQGYEDLNDHDTLRHDALLALGCGQETPGEGLASRSTLNRLELTPAEATERDRYHKIVYEEEAIARWLVEVFLDRDETPPERIVLDLDATDDPLHGEQEGRFFHGYYRSYCYLPLYIFCGDAVLCAKLRRSNIDASAGAVEEVERIVAQIRGRWPGVEIWLRADSGFARESLMAWCETHSVEYVFGLARNSRLQQLLAPTLEAVRTEQAESGAHAVRRYEELRYQTLQSWSRERRVVGKAERLGDKDNPRFVVTSLAAESFSAPELYAEIYCARGDMENRIKEQQLDLFADRTSSHTMRANQLRLWLSSVAYILITELRRIGLAGTELARAQAGTLRVRLLKIAAVIRRSTRRIYVSLSSAHPAQAIFAEVLARLRALPPRAA